MFNKSFWKRFFSFVLTIGIGLFAANIIKRPINIENSQEKSFVKNTHFEKGTGISSGCKGLSSFNSKKPFQNSESKQKALQILSKPQPKYTDSARQNNVEGATMLKVTFLKNGQIGDVYPITNLPEGLTEQAIIAAKQIKFKPAVRNGESITVTKTVQYTFTIY